MGDTSCRLSIPVSILFSILGNVEGGKCQDLITKNFILDF